MICCMRRAVMNIISCAQHCNLMALRGSWRTLGGIKGVCAEVPCSPGCTNLILCFTPCPWRLRIVAAYIQIPYKCRPVFSTAAQHYVRGVDDMVDYNSMRCYVVSVGARDVNRLLSSLASVTSTCFANKACR
jgi:hypothetical protein